MRCQTGLGDIAVKVPKVRDRSGWGIKFNSKWVPPYLKRTKAMDEFIPWLYLQGMSSGAMQPALVALPGEGAAGLSAHTVSRLKLHWEQDYDQWRHRDLSKRRYVYSWADGVYCNVRMDDRLRLPVLTGADDTGRKAVLAVVDGYHESEAGWVEVIEQRESQGLPAPPNLITGDGTLGLWKAVQPKIREARHDIWMADTRQAAHVAFDSRLRRFEAKYPCAMECPGQDKDQPPAFYDFPAGHWSHIRTTKPIESVFATVR